MSELCLEHFNKIFNMDIKEHQVIRKIDFCKQCGEYKPCVVKVVRRKSLLERFIERKNLKKYYKCDNPSNK